MKVVVCIRQSADGEINPFDASAYETALRIKGAEITILSMGPEKTADFLENLTRLGVSGAVHHIAGIRQSGTVIAVNSDKDAPIFKYADYGIVAEVKEIF